MEIRKTESRDLGELLEIYEAARAFMREIGNPNQWTKGYPDKDILIEDINMGVSYVCCDAYGISAVFSLICGEDPTYCEIHNGSWLNDRPYAAVHRLAVRTHQKGVAAFCLDWCFKQYNNLRIDTHRDNLPMQSLLKKCGFQYCGVIYLPDGAPRLAYQKVRTYGFRD